MSFRHQLHPLRRIYMFPNTVVPNAIHLSREFCIQSNACHLSPRIARHSVYSVGESQELFLSSSILELAIPLCYEIEGEFPTALKP